MADNPEKFCTYCGQSLSGDASFCPSCGALLDSNKSADPVQQQSAQNTSTLKPSVNNELYSRLKTWSIILSVVGIILIIESLPILVQLGSLESSITGSSEWPNFVKEMKESMGFDAQQTLDFVMGILKFTTISFFIGGVSMAIGAVCGFTKKMYVLGLVMYIVATVVTCWTVIGLIMGILGTVRYAGTKPCFS